MKYIQPSSSSNSKWEYSKLLNKLYIDMNTWLQVNILSSLDWLIDLNWSIALFSHIYFISQLIIFIINDWILCKIIN